MTIETAMHSEVFLTYLKIIGGLLIFAGAMIAILRVAGKNVSGVWNTYRGWLVMIPIVIGTIFLGREATIIGIALLADAARLGKVIEENLIDEGLTFLIGGQLDIVGKRCVDAKLVTEGVAETFPRGLRGGDGGIDHGKR